MISFIIPGRPVPMARPRVTAHGTYTPQKCADYKKAVALVAKAAMRGNEPLQGAVSCSISLGFAIPKSYTKGKRLAAKNNITRPTGRNTGDADNHAKAILDACTGIVWRDDSQIVSLSVAKWWGRECAEVTVIECGEGGLDGTTDKSAN